MNDRELLKLAAKAAGYEVEFRGNVDWECYVVESKNCVRQWNPIKHDGDALRLAVELGIKDYFGIEIQESCVQCTAFKPWEHCEYEEYKNQDPYAATRRAIVRAAAEIGKDMK